MNELLSIFLLLEKDKFDITQADIIDKKFSPTAREEFASVSEIIENIFINADDSFYPRIKDCYWCNNNTCSVMRDNHYNGTVCYLN